MNERACIYRKQHGISDELGTAVNVQAMAFGNKGETSATGVAFTRNPADGTKEFYGDFLVNAQARTSSPASETPSPSPTSRPPRASSPQARSSSACS